MTDPSASGNRWEPPAPAAATGEHPTRELPPAAPYAGPHPGPYAGPKAGPSAPWRSPTRLALRAGRLRLAAAAAVVFLGGGGAGFAFGHATADDGPTPAVPGTAGPDGDGHGLDHGVPGQGMPGQGFEGRP